MSKLHSRDTTPRRHTKPSELTQEQFDAWPKCAVPACENKCCLRLQSIYCWPHTPGTPREAAENLIETESNEVEILAEDWL